MESQTFDWISQVFNNGGNVSVWVAVVRLGASFVLGSVVAWIYRVTQEREEGMAQSFAATLVMMTILIAVSTQVIGDNVARAFSLVGALSIVRFRTVVKDTRDTAFVVFAVVVGMAAGAGRLSIALVGTAVAGLAAFATRPQQDKQREANMLKRTLPRIAALTLLTVTAFAQHADTPAKQTKAEKTPAQEKSREADRLFGLDKVWTIHLKLTPEALKGLEPANSGPMRFGDGGGPPGGERRSGESGPPPGPPGAFAGPQGPPGPQVPMMMNNEYPEVKAAFEFEGETMGEIGLRYKGNSTFMAARNSLKKSFKLDFNQFVKKQKFLGLTKLNLNNNALDPSQIREALSYEIFRQAGAPAPRTAFARVYLSAPGEHERTYLGLYTIVEQVDERLLQKHFASKDGLLLKPQRVGGLPSYGDEWENYVKPYEAKNEVPEAEARRFISLTKLVNNASDDQFRAQIRSFINVDAFMRFLALNGMMVNMDSILSMGQNFYIYHDTAEDQFYWIPWDLNMSFGGFPAGSAEQMMELSLTHPHAGQHKLIDRLLAMEDVKRAYLGQVRKLTETVYRVEKLNALIDRIKTAVRPSIAEESDSALAQFDSAMKETITESSARPARDDIGAVDGPGRMGRMARPLKPFIAGRIASVRNQLAGKSEGYVPQSGGFGPGGGGRPPGGFGPGGPGERMRFGPGGFLARPLLRDADQNQDGKLTQLELTNAATRWFTEWNTAKKPALDAEAIAGGLGKFGGAPPTFGPPDGPRPPGMPAGGPGAPLATGFLRAADANRDAKLTRLEFKNAFGKWFKQWDADKSGALDEKEMREGLAQVLMPADLAPPDFQQQSATPRAPQSGKAGTKKRN